MSGGFKPLYRMGKCRNCPLHCRPCLTIEQAEEILAKVERRTFNGDDLCQECHKKSNASANRWAKNKVYGDEEQGMTLEQMEAEIARLTKLLAKKGNLR